MTQTTKNWTCRKTNQLVDNDPINDIQRYKKNMGEMFGKNRYVYIRTRDN